MYEAVKDRNKTWRSWYKPKESSYLVSSSTDASNQQPENPEEKEPLNDEVVSRNLKPKN